MAISIGPRRSPFVQQLASRLASTPSTPVYGAQGAIANLGQPIAGALLAKAGEASQRQEEEAETTALGRMLKEAASAQSQGQDPIQAGLAMAEVQDEPGWAGARSKFTQLAQANLAQSLVPQKRTPQMVNAAAMGLQPGTAPYNQYIQSVTAKGGQGTSIMQNAAAMGLKPGTPAYNNYVHQASTKPLVSLGGKGYQPAPGGGLQAVKGGPADPATIAATEVAKKTAGALVKRTQSFPKVKASMRALNSKWDRLDRAIDKALTQVSPWTTGLAANAAGIKGTPQYDLARTLDTIKANIGFDELQKMRDASPTGGALGQVSEMENRLLQAVRGSTDQGQSTEQLTGTLKQIKNDLGSVRREKLQAFQMDYADLMPESKRPRIQDVDTQTTGQADETADATAQAREAIRKGADPQAVGDRLRSMGVDPGSL